MGEKRQSEIDKGRREKKKGKERERRGGEGRKNKVLHCWLTSQRVTTAKAGAALGQEAGASFEPHRCMQGTKHLGHLPLLFPGHQ